MPGTEELRSRVNGIMAGMADVLGSGQSGRGAEGGGRRSRRSMRSMRSVGSWHFLSLWDMVGGSWAGSWQGAR